MRAVSAAFHSAALRNPTFKPPVSPDSRLHYDLPHMFSSAIGRPSYSTRYRHAESKQFVLTHISSPTRHSNPSSPLVQGLQVCSSPDYFLQERVLSSCPSQHYPSHLPTSVVTFLLGSIAYSLAFSFTIQLWMTLMTATHGSEPHRSSFPC